MFNLSLCNEATIRYSLLKFGHMHLCGKDYKYFSSHSCKCNSFGCIDAIKCGNASHGPHSDSVYSGSEHNQFNWPRLVKREAGFPNPRQALISSSQLRSVNDSPYYRGEFSAMAALTGKVIRGVPQGSILCALLFLICVNDIPETVVNVAKMFADDTMVYAEIIDHDACRSLQNDLTRLSAWSREWLLNFNGAKCVVLRIHEAINYMYTLDGIPLATELLQKDLGVIISDTLKLSAHITSITKKANQHIGLIKRCFSGLNFDKVDRLFKGIIWPIPEYGSPVWNPWITKAIDSLEKMQKRCNSLASDYESHAWLGLAPCSLEKKREKYLISVRYINMSMVSISIGPTAFSNSATAIPETILSRYQSNSTVLTPENSFSVTG